MRNEQRLILISGANKGIGFELVQKLVRDSSSVILLGCRDRQRGKDAWTRLGSPSNVHLLQLDVTSRESIDAAVEEIRGKFGGRLDVLINNAAIGDDQISVSAAKEMFATNYTGMKILTEEVFPLMRENGRIVNVASECGNVLLVQASKDLQAKYLSPTLTREQLEQLIEEFISAIESGALEESGYNPRTPYLIYSATKAAVIALTRIEAREQTHVYAVCPGFCHTDLNRGAPGGRPAALGADSILHVVNTPHCQLKNGGFYRDGLAL